MKEIFLILTVFVIVVYIYFNTSNFGESQIVNLEEKLYNGDKLNGYRLADVIFYPDYLTTKHQYSTADHLHRFPDTIGTIYVKRKFPELRQINKVEDFEKHKEDYARFETKILANLPDYKIDIDLLNDIIKEKQFPQPNFPYSTLMLHVRVGDVLCNYNDMDHAYTYSKVGNFDWWEKVLKYIHDNKIKRVVIIAGTHFKECLTESVKYLETIKDTLQKKNLNVSYRVGNSPDEDLAYCRHAKHFITTGGGYGYFLGKIVELNGGNFVLNKRDTLRGDRKLF
jgi:hypothetical protein